VLFQYPTTLSFNIVNFLVLFNLSQYWNQVSGAGTLMIPFLILQGPQRPQGFSFTNDFDCEFQFLILFADYYSISLYYTHYPF